MDRLFRLRNKSKLEKADKDTPTKAELSILLCSIYLEDFRIPLEDLILCGKGLKWFEDAHEMIEAINRVGDHIEEDEDGKKCVKMPTGLHKAATRVASRHEMVFGYETIVNTWPHTNKYIYCQGLSLVLKHIREHPLSPEHPKLELLQLHHKEDSACLPIAFFNGMKSLRVLSLDVPSVPYSLHMLINLRALCLKVYELENMGWIGGLHNLESLILSTVSSTEIPMEIGELHNLKLLDLREMNIEYIPSGVLSRMLELEELYLPLGFKRWGCKVTKDIDDYDEDECSNGEERINASVGEILSLSLNVLEVCFVNDLVLPMKSTVFTNLLHFKIVSGSHQSIYKGRTNELQLTGDACSIKDSGICDLVRRTECLRLIRMRNLRNVRYQLEDYEFQRLKKMIIAECDELEHVVDTQGLWVRTTLFWELESLHLSMLPNLRGIWQGKKPIFLRLCNLTEINIRFCHKLRYVFPLSMANGLAQLQSIEVLECDEMEGIFYKNKVDDRTNAHTTHWNFLRNINLHSLPKLSCFLIQKGTTDDEQLMNRDITTKQSVTTDQSCFSSTHMKMSKHVYQQFVSSKQGSLMNTDLIKHMEAYCGFSSSSTNTSLEGLEKLKIAFCDAINVVFLFDGIGATSRVLSSLKELELFGLRNLMHIWFSMSQKITGFQNLQLLVVSECRNKYVFSPQVVKMLVQLQKVEISRCEEMEEIVVADEEEDEIVFPKLKTLELQNMPNLRTFYGGICTIEFSVLESLKLKQCSKMDLFCYKSPKTPMLERVQLNQSSYPLLKNLNATIKWFLWGTLENMQFWI